MAFFLLFLCGFIGLEVFSYILHRWFFHGILWKIHITHHTPRKGWLELNDLFSLLFGALSIGLMFSADTFPVGLGIAVYGVFYFIIHDLFTHRRFYPFNSANPVFLAIRAAHQSHHQSSEKPGIEPYGLFIFNYAEFWRKASKKKAAS